MNSENPKISRCESDWDPEDLEWLAQQPESSDEDSGDGGTEPPLGPSLDDSATSPEATPPTCYEEHPTEMKLPALRQDASDVDPNIAIAEKEPLLNELLVSQLAGSVPDWLSKRERIDGAIDLYRRFEPQDAVETVLSTLAVGLLNASMDGLERAGRSGLKPEVRQMELKLSHNGAAQVTNLIKTFQAHRGLGTQNVNVGSVNVGSGGNAIVGNVAPPKSDKT